MTMHNGSMSTPHLRILRDGMVVDGEFYDRIYSAVGARLATMLEGTLYTAEMLVGEEVWRQLSNGQCRLAGRCISDMVSNNDLPLVVAETRHEYPKKYLLRCPEVSARHVI